MSGVWVVLIATILALFVQTMSPTEASVAWAPSPSVTGTSDSTPPPEGSTPPPVPPQPAVDCARVKCVALTLDDGPVKNTSKVLDALAAKGAHATFFVLGSMAKKRPALLRRMIAEGHAVGNHSWDHPMLFRLSSGKIRSEFARTEKALTAAIGDHHMLVRTPFGQQDKRIRKILGKMGSPVIMWSVDPQDWKDRKTDVVIRRVVKATRRNSIVLMHDVWPTTRAAVPTIIAKLQAKGYVLVTVPELLGSRARAGKAYFHR
jgi:peptidoglycan/xylan/chitin deacetylase (PgdA/CDA1 family)